MAGVLLDSIINETIHKSFGGNDLLEESLLKELQGSHQHDSKFSIPPALLSTSTSSTTQNTNLAFVNRDNTDSSAAISDQLDSLSQQPWQNVEMGQNERLFWVLIFSIMVLVAAGGNTIVVYIVSTNKEMKSVTNYFLVNLSLADTMVSTLNVIFNFISMLLSHWPFGKIYCKISNFIAILSISASVFTLTAISCDRYNAILHPLRPRMSHRHAIGWILLIWTLSSALAMPNAIYSTLVEDRLVNDNVAVTCAMVWPDGRYPLSSYDHIYNIVVLVVTYLVPIITMAILYYKVGKELWGYEAIGENIDKQQRALMAKKKIVKMMIVVVIIFALCWLPYHAFFVVNYYVPTIFQDVPLHYQRCYLFMYWLAMSNSMYNPIIIYFMNSNFRREFKKILCLLFCCRVYIPSIRSNVNNTNNNNNNNNNNMNNYNSTYSTNNKSFVNHAKRQSSQDSQRNLKRVLTVEDKNNHVDLAAAQKTHDNDVEIVIEEDEREEGNSNNNNIIEKSSKNSENCRQSIEFKRNNQNIEGYQKVEEEEGEPFIAYNSKTETTMTTTMKHKNDLNKVNEKLIQFTNNNKTTAITNRNSSSNKSSNNNNTSTTTMVKNNPDKSNNHKVWI